MKKRILVVDDDNMNLARTRIILGKEYDVVLADSGIEALAKLQNKKADMVLLDIDMPGMNGLETFERMKKFAADIPVIFLTCRVDRESVKKAISLKPDGYLSKSLSVGSVKKEIDHFFERRGRAQ